MAEKNDDIKNLFMNLGLNPSDYHEIRTAPTANATVSEAPRRWSLLQAAAAPKAIVPIPLPQATMTPPSVPVVSADRPPVASLSAALLAAAQDIARAESTAQPKLEKPAAAPSVLPPALADALLQPSPADGLQSLFQSVKEPQTVLVVPTPKEASSVTARPTDQFYGASPAAVSLSERAATLPEARTPLLPEAPARLLDAHDEPATRYTPQPSRLGPIPSPVVAPSVAEAHAPTPASGRLRFAVPAAEQRSGHGESLQDVFRRLSRDNRS
ncbi:MAG: hypothetical protein Q7J29_14265 [Stagnimonas sp.]|nr:hypothetical protein [Stagnimonas sp.]